MQALSSGPAAHAPVRGPSGTVRVARRKTSPTDASQAASMRSQSTSTPSTGWNISPVNRHSAAHARRVRS